MSSGIGSAVLLDPLILLDEMTTMSHENKLELLDGIYRVYEEFITSQPIACKRYCAACCTCDVTLTTLEGYRIISSLAAEPKAALIGAFRTSSRPQGFRPALTTNQLAAMCMADEEIPEEATRGAGTCPLLYNRACSIYSFRPFACRCMVSKRPCGEAGFADMDEFVLTVNNLFLQYIEHIDRPGMSGNLEDVIGILTTKKGRNAYLSGKIFEPMQPLILNAPIPALMIPPRHRQRIQPILAALAAVLA
jgi:Fe-S-cluster containining protein